MACSQARRELSEPFPGGPLRSLLATSQVLPIYGPSIVIGTSLAAIIGNFTLNAVVNVNANANAGAGRRKLLGTLPYLEFIGE